MHIRELATTDTTALIERLLGDATAQSVRDIQAVQPLIVTALQQLEEAVTAARINPAKDVEALAARLADEAGKQAEAAVAYARHEAQIVVDGLHNQIKTINGEKEQLTLALSSASAQIEELGKTLQGQSQLVEGLREKQAQASAAIEDLKSSAQAQEISRKDLETRRVEVEKQLAAEQKTKADLEQRLHAAETQRTQIEAALATEQHARASIEKDQAAIAQELSALREATERAQHELAQAQMERDSVVAEQQALVAEHARALVDLQKRLDASVAAEARLRTQAAAKPAPAKGAAKGEPPKEESRQHAMTFIGAAFDRLVTIAETMSDASTMEEVVGTMVESLSAEFSRVALFRVQRNRLEGVRAVGFEDHMDLSQIVIPRTIDSLLTRAAKSGEIETLSGSEVADASGTPFGGTPATVLALPIFVEDEAYAVVYADDAGEKAREFSTPELRTKFAELLQQYATPLLGRLSTELKALAGMREYAKLLVDELEYTYSSAQGGSDETRREQLAQNLECARGLYMERARAEGPRAAKLLDEQIVQAIKAHQTAPFGRELVALLARNGDASRMTAAANEKSAQAS